MEMLVQNILLVFFSLAMIIYVSPWFLIALVPLFIFFIILNIIFSSGVSWSYLYT